MFKNAFYNTKTDTLHLWETVKGENQYTEIPWVPYVFIKSDGTNIQTIEGINVKKREFQTYRDYYTYCKDNHNIFENKVKPEIQFLAERYHGIPDDELEIPRLLTYHLDIETISEYGFPDTNEANDPITLISLKNSITGETITFGEKEYSGNKRVTYTHCSNEKDLLSRFFKYMNRHSPDIISGWNIYNFDLPYIINRSKRLFGEKANLHRFMSPIQIVRTWISKKNSEMNIDIAGVNILDYYQLYKWYSPHKLESYTLDFVSKFELEKGKLDYSEYKDLKDLYHNNWNKYVDYNIVDCECVYEIDNKLGYIKLIQALSLLTKCPMKFYNTMTHLIEGAMITYFRRNNLCAPYLSGGTQKHFPAAHVKEPLKGMYEWIIDIDIASSYPSHIIALNMSIETYIGRIMGLKESEIIYNTKNANFPKFDMLKDIGFKTFKDKSLKSFNMAIKRGLIAISPCGSVFSTTEPGVLANVEKEIYLKRKDVQKKRKEILDLYPESERVDQLFSLQWAIKILLNAMFGILAVPYSRYFNVNIAEAITSCGRHTIKQGEVFVNEYYKSKMIKGLPDDLVCYIDTDSLFVRLGDYFQIKDKHWNEREDDQKISYIKEEVRLLINHVNNRIFYETQLRDYNSQEKDFKIKFEQEIIAKTALFVKKKKYAYWCIDKAGRSTDELLVTGLELVRSDSSEAAKVKIKHIMEMIMKREPDTSISKMIQKYEKELRSALPEEIAANIGINNINKYIVDGKSIKGTPWHVKGVANYRALLDYYGIKDKYEDIYDSVKAKVVYIKKNIFGTETITFHRWPKEFDSDIEVDYDTMIDKFFSKKIGFLLEPMGKISLLENDKIKEVLNAFFI